MDRIASFSVDHTKLNPGMYISRIDGDIITYDVRIKKPNGGDYLPVPTMHTIEHLFATYARNSDIGKDVIYVGPMGCRTGFYLLMRSSDRQAAINLVLKSFEFISSFSGTVPGTTAPECGNYLEHDLVSAKKEAEKYLIIIRDWTVPMLEY